MQNMEDSLFLNMVDHSHVIYLFLDFIYLWTTMGVVKTCKTVQFSKQFLYLHLKMI